MNVTFTAKATVKYIVDLEMSASEYKEWLEKLDSSRGYEQSSLCAELLEKAGGDLGDPSDWGDLEFDDLV
jgi:hypothetical protein